MATPDSLWWREPGRPEVTLTLAGPFDTRRRRCGFVADSIVFVDEAAWDRATAHAGFRSADDRGVVAEYRLDTEVPTDVQIRGRLQWGFEYSIEAIPISQGPSGTSCQSSGIDGVWATAGIGDVASVSIDGATPFDVRFTDTVPGTATRIAVYEVDLDDGPMGHGSTTTSAEVTP